MKTEATSKTAKRNPLTLWSVSIAQRKKLMSVTLFYKVKTPCGLSRKGSNIMRFQNHRGGTL